MIIFIAVIAGVIILSLIGVICAVVISGRCERRELYDRLAGLPPSGHKAGSSAPPKARQSKSARLREKWRKADKIGE